MAHTLTGKFPIGFRRGWSDWQKDLTALLSFAKQNQFAGIDVGACEADTIQQITSAGLRPGSVDLKDWTNLLSKDPGKRKAAAEANAAMIKALAPLGAKVFFTVLMPEDHAASRKDNLKLAVDGYQQLCSLVSNTGARIVIEGWPGGGPHFSSLACTPESYRLVLREVGSPVLGVNFDPSHLIRMFINPVRFLEEFAPRVHHVHGKDTEIFDEMLYECGSLQPATDTPANGFGEWYWRYTIPGQGCARWKKMFQILQQAKYSGMVSIELEDGNYNGTEPGEKQGLIAGRQFLENT